MMRKILVLTLCFLALSTAAQAQQPTVSMTVEPDRGPGDASFKATYTWKDAACPSGQPIEFSWNPQGAALGTAQLGEHGGVCTATLTATPPAEHRTPGEYTVCGTYTTSEGQTLTPCADYTVEGGTAGGGTTGSPGASPTGGGTGTGTGGGTGGGIGGGHGGAATTSPGAQPTGHATEGGAGGPEHEAVPPGSSGSSAVPLYIGLALMLIVAVIAMKEGMPGQGGH